MSDPGQDVMSTAHRRGCVKRFRSLRAVLVADLYRYAGRTDMRSFLKHYAFTPGYKYTVIMRTCGYLRTKPAMALGLYPLFKLLLLRARYKYGIAIPEYTVIGPGFFINRFGGIYVNGDVVIGRNVNYTHGAMLGQLNRGPRAGNPVLGDRVLIASGAKIIGRIRIGHDCSIGANAVVTKDVPDTGVVGGVPAKLLSMGGSEGYINRQVPEALMRRCDDAFVGPVDWGVPATPVEAMPS
ncbi:serine O-acetyltransferase [Sphingomonas gellani]|uniref:Serine O-acetyltransferase n=1 Tax=Sphingomonas gellani TaxID=1166340 RepID=A0A1H8HVS1_9SPHN|nr:serine acetyltransferase [Sphingomonas gellani]SEN60490.1 serine O-acetyltransferase [Sphingomonas gellani]